MWNNFYVAVIFISIDSNSQAYIVFLVTRDKLELKYMDWE